jgi:dCMP deaminase
MNWDQYYKELCLTISKKSKDNSTQIGAVIAGPDHEVRSTGYNDFPRGVNDFIKTNEVETRNGFFIKEVFERRQRPQKYLWTEHAERNAIYNAARCGIALKGCSIYIVPSKPLFVCADCGRAIIQSGIIEVIIDLNEENNKSIPDHWEESCRIAAIMFEEAGVKVRRFDIPKQETLTIDSCKTGPGSISPNSLLHIKDTN